MSTSSNLTQSVYSPSDWDPSQNTPQNRTPQNSLNRTDISTNIIDQSLKNAQKELHQKRVQSIRKELDYLKATAWEFEHDKGFVQSEVEDDDEKEDFLAGQLVELEASCQYEENSTVQRPAPAVPRNAECYQRTGKITYMTESYVLIDGMLYFDISNCSVQLNDNDKVLYLCYKDANESVIVVRILENLGNAWCEGEEETEEHSFKILNHVMIGEVDYREDRRVFIKNSDLNFSLDQVEASFIPIKGDWLEMTCSIQYDEDKPSDISTAQVLQVVSFKPLRKKVKSAVVTRWTGESGVCDRDIYFDKQSLQNEVIPYVGSQVVVEAIESNQEIFTWRVVKLITINTNLANGQENSIPKNENDSSVAIEEEKKIELTNPITFENVDIEMKKEIDIILKNNSTEMHILNKWIILSKRKDSQITIKPFLNKPLRLYPKQSCTFTVECHPKFLGSSMETLVFLFKGFQLKRNIEINVVSNNLLNHNGGKEVSNPNSNGDNIQKMINIRRNDRNNFIPGVRPVKPPAFIPVRLGMFPIPEKVWTAVLGDSQQTIYSMEYDIILERMARALPCLTQNLTINNYIDKWHTLLYMEEVQVNICMRAHDMPKVFLIRCQEFLGIEIKGLSEMRPSLIKGDRAIVKDIWDPKQMQYEGYVHSLKGDLVLLKFNSYFHETYTGSDVAIEFHFNRSTYRRAHQAINLALSNLGADILIPSRVLTNTPQVERNVLEKITWYNDKLNDGQKTAVKNILLGKSRPLPYCIFGPPGTGKTVTVIETILQILTQMPDSRILVATPSNSAANLITERLIQYRNSFSDSVIRLIANYLLDSDNIPDVIRPFCATMDIAREFTSKSKQTAENGINLNCQTEFIGRHRVTIGTCYCLGTLALMGLPKGHFTHIIVDEAGQATEPEIMIPMTFTNKENGQIILAGDPMQLGPVVISKYCKEYGMDESYLSRILETFPYQRDFQAFGDGFNDKLVTKLNDNYRSVEEVLKLPSEMFYNASLVPKLDKNEAWILKAAKVVSEVFNSTLIAGGIYVHGIRGSNARAEDSPSWYNPQEASMVALTTCKLYKYGISADDIGIITPYIAQTKYLRLLFDAMGLSLPKIGTVEEFQGQERPIILISTVRSSESLLSSDLKHSLGFVQNPKRLNVALTRAQVAVLLFCNPHLLCTDPMWRKVVKQAVDEDKYIGCDLPSGLRVEESSDCT